MLFKDIFEKIFCNVDECKKNPVYDGVVGVVVVVGILVNVVMLVMVVFMVVIGMMVMVVVWCLSDMWCVLRLGQERTLGICDLLARKQES